MSQLQVSELMYDRVKDSLRDQAAHYDALISRISTMFTASTAIVGIGMPLAISQLPADQSIRICLISFAAFPVLGYVIAAWIGIRGLTLGRIQTLDVPSWVRSFDSHTADAFRRDIWLQIEKSHKKNDDLLIAKGKAAKLTLNWSAYLTIMVVGYVIAVVLAGFSS